jgi:hypothetical protein
VKWNQPQFQTNVYSFEGPIQVTSTTTGQGITLNTGQGLNAGGAGLGNPFPTPPGVSSQFQADTSAPGGGGGTGTGGAGGGTGTGPETGSGPSPPDTSSVTQNQNTSNLATATTRPTNHEGFLSVMLANTYIDSFDSRMISTTAQDFNSSSFQSSNPFGGSASITANGSSGSFNPTITDVKETGGTSMTSGVPVTVSPTELGYNAYVEWGYWTQPQPMSNGLYTYAFIDRGYYVQGDVTTNAQMAALKASGVVGTYTGKAYGTYSDSNGVGYYMPNGTFSATVNFSTPSISNFNFSVTDGTHTASVTGATGSFSGSTGQFNVTTGGTVLLTGSATPIQKSYGAIYGSNGQAIGGVWGIKDPSNSANAVGVFQGVR